MVGSPPDEARAAFEDALLRAITEGRVPTRSAVLTVSTWSAIAAIAREHPEATVAQISEAYDIFEREMHPLTPSG